MRVARAAKREAHHSVRPTAAGVWGSSVKNLQGERIGVITDVVIEPERTKVIFVVIELDHEFAAMHGTRIAVSWSLLRLNLNVLDRSAPYLLGLSRRQLWRAPRIDDTSFSELCAREFGDRSRSAMPRLLRLPLR